MLMALKTLLAVVALWLTAIGWASAAGSDVPQKQIFVTRLQQAVRTNDKAWMAAHTRYPLRSFGSRQVSIRSKSSFIKNYSALIGGKVRAAVLAQDPTEVFENWQGLMIGDGLHNIWIRNANGGLDERYQIITINDGR
jgi:hypothetical protein